MSTYYDGTKLLSLKDRNGQVPEIFMVTSNRNAGKTTYFGRLLVNRFLKKGEKFCLLYRFNYELDDCATSFFKNLRELFFPDMEMESEKMARGVYHVLKLNGVPCGYAIALNNADQIKRKSSMFSDVSAMLFDEFQSETNHYCADEVKKFISVHTSIARGNGKQVRYVPVYMLSNTVTLLNPYYVEMGVCDILEADTNFLRGDGYVIEQGYNESASEAQKLSAFNRAFAGNAYVAYAAEKVYLKDSSAFVEKPKGKFRYICTLKYMGHDFGIREFPELGIIHCSPVADLKNPTRICVTTEDHDVNYVMLKRSDFLLMNLRWFFEKGCFRFADLKSKQCVLQALCYNK